MFNALRKSLSNVLSRFTKKAEEVQEPEKEEVISDENVLEQVKISKDTSKQKKETTENKEKPETSKEKHEISYAKPEPVKTEISKTQIHEPEKPKIVQEKHAVPETIRAKPEPALLKSEPVKAKPEQVHAPTHIEPVHADDKKPEHPEEPKKGWFGAIASAFTQIRLSPEKFDELFWELELGLLQNNVAQQVVEKIKDDLRVELVDKPIPRRSLEDVLKQRLRASIAEVLNFDVPDLLKVSSGKKPYVILFVGINGSGKTTTIAKICKMLLTHGKKCIMVASDTFRAAAIQQLEEHANALNVKIIKQDYGADPAAVAFDGLSYANAHDIDVVLIDTAGRLHTNRNLMDELKKVKRIAKPDLVLYIGESITGNDCIEQATIYNSEIGIDGVVLTKVDVDEKGGTPISIAYVSKKPIWLIGTGQNYSDLHPFDAKKIIDGLGL